MTSLLWTVSPFNMASSRAWGQLGHVYVSIPRFIRKKIFIIVNTLSHSATFIHGIGRKIKIYIFLYLCIFFVMHMVPTFFMNVQKWVWWKLLPSVCISLSHYFYFNFYFPCSFSSLKSISLQPLSSSSMFFLSYFSYSLCPGASLGPILGHFGAGIAYHRISFQTDKEIDYRKQK